MIAIVGGGAIGLACAWRLRQRGADVALFESGAVGGEASFAAGGMLAPGPEFWLHQRNATLRELGAQSRDLYPDFAAELLQLTGVDSELCLENSPTCDWRVPGILMVADKSDRGHLREWNGQSAYWFARDGQVEPRHLTRALRLACEKAGVCLRENAAVRGFDVADNRVKALIFDDGARFEADQFLLCAGAWSGQFGLPAEATPPIRPVAGQMLQLRGGRLLEHVVYGEECYLIPRRDGRLLVGATVEETGFEKRVTQVATTQLLKAARALAPILEAAPLETSWSGLRPVSPDGLPVIGGGPLENLNYATGHGRNGILLAPRTAEITADYLLCGASVPDEFSLSRFDLSQLHAETQKRRENEEQEK